MTDSFVARVNPTGSTLIYSTFFGGSGNDLANAIAVDGAGVASIVGCTSSSSFPTTPGAYDTSWNGGASDAFVFRLAIGLPSSPLAMYPAAQAIPAGGVLGLQIAGPSAAPIALMFDPVALNVPIPPYGTIGVNIPPAATVDGIGLGFPNSIVVPNAIGAQGILYFNYSPVPAFLVGSTLFAQAVAIDPLFPGGAALSTHGNVALSTTACQITFVP